MNAYKELNHFDVTGRRIVRIELATVVEMLNRIPSTTYRRLLIDSIKRQLTEEDEAERDCVSDS